MIEELLLHLLSVNAVQRATKRLVNGRTYWVANATLIVPGVLPGSKGPLYYPPEECRNSADSWNAIPIVVNHPVVDSYHVSARNPDVLARWGIGYVYNSQFNSTLNSQLWFDEENTQRVDSRILNWLKDGIPFELSTGLYTTNEEHEERIHNSASGRVSYRRTARNYRPDHLAILPDSKGACSLTDGCGVLVNQYGVANCGGVGGKPGPCPEGKSRESEAVHEASKEAHAKTEHADKTAFSVMASGAAMHYAQLKSKYAHEASERGDHETAADLHEEAAKFHDEAAEEHEKHEDNPPNTKSKTPAKDSAAIHRDAAKVHRLAAALHHDRHEETRNKQCVLDENNVCVNCGGEEGKPGPCISGRHTETVGGKGDHTTSPPQLVKGMPRLSTEQGSTLSKYDGPQFKEAIAALDEIASKMRLATDPQAIDGLRGQWQKQFMTLRSLKANEEDMEHDYNTEGVCVNCGGAGGKPGPCPTGQQSRESRQVHQASREAHELTEKAAGRNKDLSKPHSESTTAVGHSESSNHDKAAEYHRKAASEHESVAKEHREAAEYHEKDERGSSKTYAKQSRDKAEKHEKAAKAHRLAAALHHDRHEETRNKAGDTTMNKDQMISYIVTNCDCWKGATEEEKKILNGFSDDKLKKMVATEQQAQNNATLANNVRKGITTNGVTVTVNDKGELVANAGMACPEGMDKEVWGKMSEDQKKAYTANLTTNSGGQSKVRKSMAQLLQESGTPEDQAIWNSMLEHEQSLRIDLATALVSNITDPGQKQERFKFYMGFQSKDLKQFLADRGVTNSPTIGYNPNNNGSGGLVSLMGPAYTGSHVSPAFAVNNDFDRTNTVVAPTINYKELLEEQRAEDRRGRR